MTRPVVPISEDTRKFRPEWTAEDCIAELQRVVAIQPDKVISRNFFRVHSQISESTWNRYFGVFAEYKRQSGVQLTRQQHNLEKQIAKHVSVDHYRRLSKELANYEGKYLRPSGGRFKTALIISDLHDRECDPFYLEIVIDVAKRLQPDYVVYNGDIFDLPEFGRFTVDPRQWDVVGRIQFAHAKVLGPLRDATPASQFDFISGNHEHRLLKHMADATPALRSLLSDLHGMSVSKLLGLEEYGVNFICKGDLAAYTNTNIKQQVARNYKIYDDLLLCHHFPEGRRLGYPGVNGHNHKVAVYSEHNNTFGSYQWVQSGCGHVRDASYTDGERWNQGFTIGHMDTQARQVNFEYVSVTDFAVAGGKYYHRSAV